MQHNVNAEALAQLAAAAGTSTLELLQNPAAAWATLSGAPGGDGNNAAAALALAGSGGLHGALSMQDGSGDGEELLEETARPTGRASKRGRGNSSQQDYALRHQAAEQRRRARINDRLEALRKLVPHDPRANTASFLEDVIKHILMLKDTNDKLEAALLAGHAQGAAAISLIQQQQQPPQQQQQQPQQQQQRQQGGRGARANGNAPPPPQQPAPVAPAMGTSLIRETNSLQQLLAHAQQAGLGLANVGGTGGGQGQVQGMGGGGGNGGQGAHTVTLTTHGGQGVDVDIAPQVQQVLLAPTGSAEQQEALLRSLMANGGGATAVQLLSGVPASLEQAAGASGGVGAGAVLQQLLSAAASQMAAGGGGTLQLTDEQGNVLHLGA